MLQQLFINPTNTWFSLAYINMGEKGDKSNASQKNVAFFPIFSAITKLERQLPDLIKPELHPSKTNE